MMAKTPLLKPMALAGAFLLAFMGSASAQTTTEYEYDALGRLIKAERPAGNEAVIYTLDPLGNRISVIQGASGAVNFSVNDVAVSEGGILNFTVTKSGTTSLTHNVDYATSNGTATAGDYTSKSGTLSFASSETSKTVSVSTAQDSVFEGNETLLLTLSNPTGGAAIIDNQGTGTINNDDAAPSFVINNVTKLEGLPLTFTVTKSGSTALNHNVSYFNIDKTAIAGSDYNAVSGTLIFGPSDTTKQLTVSSIQETVPEADETFWISIYNATGGATIADSVGVGSILNDDNFPPNAVNDSYTVNRNQQYTFTVIANDSDPENDPLTITQLIDVMGCVSASIINNNTAISFSTTCASTETDFIYKISDGNGGTDTAIVTVTIGGGGLPQF